MELSIVYAYPLFVVSWCIVCYFLCMENLRGEKQILDRYGKVIEFHDLKNSKIKEQIQTVSDGILIHPMHLVRESEIEVFRNHVINKSGAIHIPMSKGYQIFPIDFIEKQSAYLEVLLHINGMHFIPDKILKDDILFFYQQNNQLYAIVRDEYLYQSLNSKHTIFGMIDFSNGTTLLYKTDNYVNQKMKIFHRKIDALASKCQDISFITISDSILFKYSFKMVNKEGKFQPNKLNFDRMIEIFKEIREIVHQVFQMNIYGVFTYGKNKCENSYSHLKNVTHTGILSNEFKELFDIERRAKIWLKKKRNTTKGDLYLSDCLYKAFRFYLREQNISSQYFRMPSSHEWGIGNGIVAMTIPNRHITIKNSSYCSS